ncbi:hypothetical protein TYRP_013628, partial [Tyrophagus putrescentiae]
MPLVALKLISSLLFTLSALFFNNFFYLCEMADQPSFSIAVLPTFTLRSRRLSKRHFMNHRTRRSVSLTTQRLRPFVSFSLTTTRILDLFINEQRNQKQADHLSRIKAMLAEYWRT